MLNLKVLDYYKSYNSDFDIWDESFNSEIAAFLSKKLVSFIGPSWRLNDIFRLNQTYSLGLNPEVFKMPQIDPGNPDSNIYWATYWGQAVTKDSQQRGQSAVAWDFIKFLSQPEQLRKYNELVRQQEGRNLDIIYPRIEMAQEQKSDQYLSPYIESLEQADSWDMIDGFEVSNIFKEALASASLNSDSIQSRINMEIIEQRTTLVSGP